MINIDQTKASTTSTFSGIDFPYLLSEWKQMFSPTTISKDIWAGITVALVSLPLNLALAIAAGIEPGVGITTGIVAGIVAGLFGGQKLSVTGPSPVMSVVLIEIAQNYGINAIWLVGLMAGVLQLIAGFFKFGRLISFLPMPVIVGFANAIGILIFFNSLDDFLGLPIKSLASAAHASISSKGFVPEFFIDLMDITQRCIMHQEMNYMAIAIGIVAIAIAYYTPKITKSIPGQLVGIVIATLCVQLLSFKIPIVKDTASISNLLPAPMLPHLPWHDVAMLFPTAVTIFMLGSIESLLSASIADGMTGSSRHHSNQELIGQGLANFIVPFFGGMPVAGVIARTAINVRSGAKTRLSAIVHSLVLAFLIFFLSKSVEQVPMAALAGILMLTGIRLIEWDAFSQMWQASRTEAFVSIVTTITAVGIDLTAGVFTGLVFASLLFVKQMSEVSLEEYTEQDLVSNLPVPKFVRTFVIDGPLFFAAAERFIENITVVDDAKVIILHMKAAKVIDLTGVETLLSIKRQLNRKGSRLILAELQEQPLQMLKRTGAFDKIGQENICDSYQAAVTNISQQLIDKSS